MTTRVTSVFFRVSHILVLFLLVNYVHAKNTVIEAGIVSKDNPDELGEREQVVQGTEIHKSADEEEPLLCGEPIRYKREMHTETMHVTATRDRGVHWGRSGGGSGNRNSGHRSRSSPANGIANFQKAQAALAETNSLCVLGEEMAPGKTPAPVLSVAGVGSVALTGTVGESLISGFTAAISKLATVGTHLARTSPLGVLIGSIGYVPSAGVGSDKVPGRTPENFISFAIPARVMNLPDKSALQRAAKETGVVNLPVRGELVTERDIGVRVVRTPEVQSVKVLQAVRDEKTGLFNTPLPDSVVPGGKVVTTPPTVPNTHAQGPLVNPIASPPVTVHTGYVGELRSTLVKPFPASEASPTRDAVLVYPDNSGLEPVYVMYNKPRKGVREADHDYIPAPRTEDITAFPGLIPQKRKTPRQGGGGLRERWKDAKGRTIYEWDSQHGDLEGYLASDGTHLGSFDIKTGAQTGKAKPKRKLKDL